MSAAISQCRREYGDIAKSSIAQKAGDGSSTLFNLGRYPILESSYTVQKGTSGQTEGSQFTLNRDNGDLVFVSSAPTNGLTVTAKFKYANWSDQQWVEAINQAIDVLNGQGYFRQIVRDTSVFSISANVKLYDGPANCVDVYELLESDNNTTSGNWRKPQVNWSYQQDANKIVLGLNPSQANRAAVSYLRNLLTYAATSATIDVKTDWLEAVKKKAGAIHYRAMAAKFSMQGNANVDEGHYSFTALRTQANDLDNDFDKLSKRRKPTRPAKDMQYPLSTGGVA